MILQRIFAKIPAMPLPNGGRPPWAGDRQHSAKKGQGGFFYLFAKVPFCVQMAAVHPCLFSRRPWVPVPRPVRWAAILAQKGDFCE